jgi:regulator of cell morphogenesis and NO signaling
MITAQSIIGEIAATHPLSTRVFARHRIDYCCAGNRELADACTKRGLDASLVISELEAEIATSGPSIVRWDQEPLTALIEHILTEYHAPLREELPRLSAMATKVRRVHGDRDPARFEAIEKTLHMLAADLESHMQKEENVLFPLIAEGNGYMADGPISVMEAEHDDAGRMLEHLRTMTNDYVPPDDACNTWRGLWAGLADLERALHEHIHLENNILHHRAREE